MQQKAAIPFKLMLSYYMVAPLSIGVMAYDQLALGGAWQKVIPLSPYVFFFYAVFFNLPHIVCSSVMMLNREYIGHYKKPLVWVIGAAIALPFLAGWLIAYSGLGQLYGYLISIFIFAAITLYHVFMQQLGINKLFARDGHWAFDAIAWSNILPGSGAYLLMFTFANAGNAHLYPIIYGLSVKTGVFCVGLATFLYVFCWFRSKTTAGRIYLVANWLASICGLLAIIYEYWLFALVVPRIIHDLTAFTVYINHDHNRYLEQGAKSHPIYGPLQRIGMPALVLTPLLAIAIALPITKGYVHVGWAMFYILALIHYGTESFVWKNGTPHRKYIAFSGVK